MSEPSIRLQGADPGAADTLANETAWDDSAEASLGTRPGKQSFTSKLQGYEIIDRLGEGAMGVVWKAVQLSTKRTVALKMMSAASFGSVRAALRFEREVELTASLDHPNIARVFDSGVQDGIFFYSMELIDGVPLDVHAARKKLSRRDVVSMMERICRAVQHAHQKGVIHRDLKPSNILVDAEGQPHVLDFGLAKIAQASEQISLDGEVAGTPAFMSPEQAAGHPGKLDTRSDVYTLGVILFFLLSGQYPHDLNGTYLELLRRIAEQEPRRIRDIQPKIDADLAALLGHALEREPDRRYGSAGAMAADLHRYLCGDPVSARPPSVAYRLRKRIRKRRKPLAIASVFLVLVFSILGYLAYEYYSQWGDWVQVANYDFSSEKSSVTDGLDFMGGNFTTVAVPAWPHGKDGMRAQYAEWCVLRNVHIRGDVRIVINVVFGDRPDGLEMCLNSASVVGMTFTPAGYSAQVGGYGGQIDYISRNERTGLPDESEAIAGGIQPGRSAVITFERQGEHVTLQVDKEPPIRSTQLLPLTGVGLDGVAIRSWCGTTVIRSMAVYRRSLPKKASPVVAGDSLVEAGDPDAALRQYENLADDYPHSATGEIALVKACGLACTLRPPDAERARHLRDRFASDYPHSSFGPRLLEADVLNDWQDGRFEAALAKLEQVRQIDSKTRLPLRLVASARMRKVSLPVPVGQRLMAIVHQVPGVSRLNIEGLGIASLADAARPELRHLECGSNPIPTLEPFRGVPIEELFCVNTSISSLEPLRGGKLHILAISGTTVTDLEPLRGMPLTALRCDGCPITSLEPVRGMATLTLLHAESTRVSSLEAIRGLALKYVSVDRTGCRDLGPLRGMPLNHLACGRCEIQDLGPLHGAPLVDFRCPENLIQTLEPLRGMRIRRLSCYSNRVKTLEPLRGMPLEELDVSGNPLTSLDPFVENPPNQFRFDCESLPDAELARVRDSWNKRPEFRRHAQDAEILLALRHNDVGTLKRLATTFGERRYLIAPKAVSWGTASRMCRSLGVHLATIATADENTFLAELCRASNSSPWIGLRYGDGKIAWENGDAASPSLATSGFRGNGNLGSAAYGLFAGDGWSLARPGTNTADGFIIEWDHE